MIGGMAVRIDERTMYVPDALVRCGQPLPGDAIEVLDPVGVVEVVSPAALGVDSGAKLAGYFSLPSVRHYLVSDADAHVLTHHRRDEDGGIATRILQDGRLRLDPPGLDVTIESLFPER
jgi:Uma2 family endonuclease